MKLALAVIVFVSTLGLSFETLAASGASGGHGDLGTKMNSLFPEPQKNPAQSDKPSTVKLTAPNFLQKVAANQVKLEWSAADKATNYHVQVATDPNFKWLVKNEHWIKTNSFELNGLDAGQKYYWRVAAVAAKNDSMYTKSLFVNSVFVASEK